MVHNHGYIPCFFTVLMPTMITDINHAFFIVQINLEDRQLDLPQLEEDI